MRTFYAGPLAAWPEDPPVIPDPGDPCEAFEARSVGSLCSRIAVYSREGAEPYVEDVVSERVGDHIDALTERTYLLAREAGGSVPEEAIREVVENLVHARFSEPVVSILNEGRTVRVSDSGPGISDPRRALLPGFTTADSSAKRYIRGVGSGLPLANECLSSRGGSLAIDANLGGGAVVTLSADRNSSAEPDDEALRRASSRVDQPSLDMIVSDTRAHVTARQQRVLALVMETGAAGPSLVAKELGVGLSTAHRDLAALEAAGLISSDDTGKRSLTDDGRSYLEGLLSAERKR
jgi:DNA-binding MarR family transcriptional regulator